MSSWAGRDPFLRTPSRVPALQSFLVCSLGRVAPKILSKKVRKELSRVDQRHRASQLRKQKKEAVRGAGLGTLYFLNLSGWECFEVVNMAWGGRGQPGFDPLVPYGPLSKEKRKCGLGKGPGMNTNAKAYPRQIWTQVGTFLWSMLLRTPLADMLV